MENCIYCKKDYTKRYINLHYKLCKFKNINLNIIKKNKIVDHSIDKSIFSKIPHEIMKYINLFIPQKDDYHTYKKYYKDICNIAYVSKYFYNIFMFSTKEINELKVLCMEEYEKCICKTTAKDDYQLKESELENLIPYSLCKNPHYSTSSPMKLYKLIDILDYLCKTYDTKYNRDKIIMIDYQKKEISYEKRENLKKDRKNNYEELLNKYNLIDNIEIYNKYFEYIYKGSPGIKKIEIEILKYLEIKNREDNLNKLLTENNYYYKETNISKNYINENNYTISEAYNSIVNIIERENNIKKSDIFLKNTNFNNINKNLIHDYINNNKYSLEFIIDTYNYRYTRRDNLIEELSKYNLKIRNDSELVKNYINDNLYDLDFVVKTLVEMDFYFKYTSYSSDIMNIYEDDSIERSNIAKRKALKKWCNKYNNYEDAILQNYLPLSLHNNVYQIFNFIPEIKIINKNIVKYGNKNIVKSGKCSCNNFPSPICGFCTNCCLLENCKKHKK